MNTLLTPAARARDAILAAFSRKCDEAERLQARLVASEAARADADRVVHDLRAMLAWQDRALADMQACVKAADAAANTLALEVSRLRGILSGTIVLWDSSASLPDRRN